MAILNGTDIRVYDSSSGILVAFAQSGTLNFSMSTRDITNKQSGGFKESLEGLREWSIDIDGAYAWTDASGSALSNGADDLFFKYLLDLGPNTREAFTIKFGNTGGATGDIDYQGSVFLTSVSITGGTEDTATYSMSFEGTGGLQQTVA
jgi:predicted secreted protein|tara:strand:+ start:2736 stop:3182 length:447 start_codon:yes stop_codon:yes gene_type:complete